MRGVSRHSSPLYLEVNLIPVRNLSESNGRSLPKTHRGNYVWESPGNFTGHKWHLEPRCCGPSYTRDSSEWNTPEASWEGSNVLRSPREALSCESLQWGKRSWVPWCSSWRNYLDCASALPGVLNSVKLGKWLMTLGDHGSLLEFLALLIKEFKD